MNSRTFTPKELQNVPQKMDNMRELSSGYFKVASELRDKAYSNENGVISSRYVFPTVIMYVSSLEAYFNEKLTLSSYSMKDGELKEKIEEIKSRKGDYRKFKNRIKEIFKLYDRNNIGADTNSIEYLNLIALLELRNSAVHYNPYFIEHVRWPDGLEKVLKASKIEVMNSGWVSNFSTPAVAMWAYETTRSVVQLFCGLSGDIDPFNCPDEHESFRWE